MGNQNEEKEKVEKKEKVEDKKEGVQGIRTPGTETGEVKKGREKKRGKEGGIQRAIRMRKRS